MSKSKPQKRKQQAEKSSGWQPAATAPKDRVILADLGWPWPVAALWDAECEKWACANLTVEAYQEGGAECQNVGWETEYEPPQNLKRWQEMPGL